LGASLDRLVAVLTERDRGWLDGLVAWVRKNNRIRLAKRKARRGELIRGRPALASLPVATPVTGHGLIPWLRRQNRARLARRKTRHQASLPPPGQPALWAPEAADPSAPATARQSLAYPTGLVPATAQEAWEAYPRLKQEFLRRRAGRSASFEISPRDMIRAPADLPAFASGLALPEVTAPRVSIIVPVFNHLRDTLECIASVAAHTPSNDYELIVIDDGSSDQTATVLPLVRNLRYFRNQANGGFLVSSTRGVEESRGEFLVFLNNDAQVTAGWLAPLLDTFLTFERVGAVGPKILYPDGRLQEAGAMINPDLTIDMVGHADDPRKARYSYAREVHYCSGACLVVPRRLFDEVGGFTEDLKPAYYEDCDLQLKLRRQGLRTIFQPDSQVVHYLSRTSEGLPNPTGYKLRQISRNAQWMRERWGDAIDAMHEVRLIAFYLPQFHPVRENDFWWGKGFTEWTNVAKALPAFPGHEQPHLPTELGFYDLRVPEVMHEQARLAQAYGISGFCYYYYWFNGRRLLEAPIERLLTEQSGGFPFCLCWANENWTRRWDGGDGESEILMGQAHSDQDDEAVILDLMRFLRHPSYIRVNGRPMLLVYRVGLFPDIRRTAELWRAACRREGIGEIHLVRVDSFGEALQSNPPVIQGFDAAVEFPPHHCGTPDTPQPMSLRPGFAGEVNDYEAAVLQSATPKETGYLHYRTVLPRWDNTARRPDGAAIWAGSSPGAYQAYLEELLAYTREQNVGDDRLVFINAWNEWAEGAHLEPDRRYGRTYLEATLNATMEHLVRSGR
jgi:GT2 family glycosyltransferase